MCYSQGMSPPKRDISGQRFGHLVAIRPTSSPTLPTRWLCQCDCGAQHSAAISNLTSGHVKSCGCQRFRRGPDNPSYKHGMADKTRIYSIWVTMIKRCRNPNAHAYERYGGRGITVCERWHTFTNFYADMGDPPPKLTLDRIDNDKGYQPDNCRWATRSEQRLNSRNPNRAENFRKKR